MGNLNRRERLVLFWGGIVVIVFLAVEFVYSPLLEKRENLDRVWVQKNQAVRDMAVLQQELALIPDQTGSATQLLGKKQEGFSLFTFLDRQARLSRVKEHVVYMKPASKKTEDEAYSLAKVKIKLEQIPLKPLLDFLTRIESTENGVVVNSLSLARAGREKKRLDAVIETQTLILTGDK